MLYLAFALCCRGAFNHWSEMNCTRITQTECSFLKSVKERRWTVVLRVRAEMGPRTSAWVETDPFVAERNSKCYWWCQYISQRRLVKCCRIFLLCYVEKLSERSVGARLANAARSLCITRNLIPISSSAVALAAHSFNRYWDRNMLLDGCSLDGQAL